MAASTVKSIRRAEMQERDRLHVKQLTSCRSGESGGAPRPLAYAVASRPATPPRRPHVRQPHHRQPPDWFGHGSIQQLPPLLLADPQPTLLFSCRSFLNGPVYAGLRESLAPLLIGTEIVSHEASPQEIDARVARWRGGRGAWWPSAAAACWMPPRRSPRWWSIRCRRCAIWKSGRQQNQRRHPAADRHSYHRRHRQRGDAERGDHRHPCQQSEGLAAPQ